MAAAIPANGCADVHHGETPGNNDAVASTSS